MRHFSSVALVQMLQTARNELRLEDAVHKLDKYAVIIQSICAYEHIAPETIQSFN